MSLQASPWLSPTPNDVHHHEVKSAYAGPSALTIAVGFVISLAIALACLLLRRFIPRHDEENLSPQPLDYTLPTKGSPGLEKSLLHKIKVSKFARKAGHVRSDECAVCLTPFEGHDSIRVLPHCKHAFHVVCIDEWFDSHATCPICRDDMAATCVDFAPSSSFSQSRSVSINMMHGHLAHDPYPYQISTLQGSESNMLTKSAVIAMPRHDHVKPNHDPSHTHEFQTFHNDPVAQALPSSSSSHIRHCQLYDGDKDNCTLHPNLLRRAFSFEWDSHTQCEHRSNNLESNWFDASDGRLLNSSKKHGENMLKKALHAKPPRARSFGSIPSLKRR